MKTKKLTNIGFAAIIISLGIASPSVSFGGNNNNEVSPVNNTPSPFISYRERINNTRVKIDNSPPPDFSFTEYSGGEYSNLYTTNYKAYMRIVHSVHKPKMEFISNWMPKKFTLENNMFSFTLGEYISVLADKNNDARDRVFLRPLFFIRGEQRAEISKENKTLMVEIERVMQNNGANPRLENFLRELKEFDSVIDPAKDKITEAEFRVISAFYFKYLRG